MTRTLLACLVVIVMFAFAAAGAGLNAQESESFKVKDLSVAAVADAGTSSGYRSAMTSTPVDGAVGVCPAGTSTTLGFFSYLGSQEVPTMLTVDKDNQPADNIELNWTGQATGFHVYKGNSPVGLTDAPNLFTTTGFCTSVDPDVDVSPIAFYLIVPSSP